MIRILTGWDGMGVAGAAALCQVGWRRGELGIAVRENHYVEEAVISTWIMVNRSPGAWESWSNRSQVR